MNWQIAIYLTVMLVLAVAAGCQIRTWPRGFAEWLFFTILTGVTLFLAGYTVKFLL